MFGLRGRDRHGRASRAVRLVVAAAAGAVIAAALPTTAFADPPGPTDFDTTVVAIEPPQPGVSVSIVAGDAFFVLDVEPGVEVSVPGYQGEPYLEFLPSGEVRENRASPTYHASREKSGAAVPAGITVDTPPAWTVVSRDGTYAWHDHRSHWMGGTPPVDLRGEVVQEGTVPLVVDGADVTVRVRTVWRDPPSPVAPLAGIALGLVLGATLLVGGRRTWIGAAAAIAVSAAALGVGIAEFVSVPPVTGPPITAWLIPATALAAAVVGTVLARRAGSAVYAAGAHVVVGVELALWSFTRRSGLTAAILPTDLPFWLDRAVTGAAGAFGLLAAVAALVPLVGWLTRPPQSVTNGV